MLRNPLIWALIATLTAGFWLWVEVEYDRGGNLTGLYYTGQFTGVPPQLGSEAIYRVPGDRGYDGQFYHYIAHDPLLRRGFERFVDNPRLRWRRIFVPGLACVLALGSDVYVDSVYVGVVIGFVLLGSWWLGQLAVRYGRHPAWALAFLLIPAVLVSLDRMTIDVALAALTIGFVLCGEPEPAKPLWPMWPILVAAPLVRETGALLVIGFALYSAIHRRWRTAVLASFCLLPTLGWWLYVSAHTGPDLTPWLAHYPFSGLIERTVYGVAIPPTGAWLLFAARFERLALAGLWLAVFATFWLAWRRRWNLPEATSVVLVIFAAALGKLDIWADTYAAARTLSPLSILLGVIALRDRRWVYALPLLAALPRIALQYEVTLKAVFRGIVKG